MDNVDISSFDPAVHDPATFLQQPETTQAAEKPAAETKQPETEVKPEDETVNPEAKADEDETKQGEEETKAEKTKDIRVPKSRLDQALARSRALQERVKELEAQVAGTKPEGQVDSRTALSQAREKYEDALLEGDRAAIKAARQEVEQAEERYLEERTSTSSRAATTDAQAQAIFEDAVAAVEADYPAFDQSHADFNADAMGYALGLMEGLVKSGMTHVEAMAEAAELTALKFSLQRAGAAPKADVAATRKTEALKKAADAASRQPPSQARGGVDHTAAGGSVHTVDGVAKLDSKSFDKLMKDDPAAVMRLLEGR